MAPLAYRQPQCTNCKTLITWPDAQTQQEYYQSQDQYYQQQTWQQYQAGQQYNQYGQYSQYSQQEQQAEAGLRSRKKKRSGSKKTNLLQTIAKLIRDNRQIVTRVAISAGVAAILITALISFQDEIGKLFTVPTISSFEISQSEIPLGQSATLVWDVKGATSVTISPDLGTVPSSGSKIVSPSSSMVYTLTAKSVMGSANRTVKITVKGPLPTIKRFSFNTDSIIAGQSATMFWEVSDATSVSINPDVGEVPASGTKAVTPANTTTYTLTASNDSGNSTSTAVITVTISKVPIINDFSAEPLSIKSGESSVIRWDVIGATSININQGIGGVASKGSWKVTPVATTTFTLTADSGYGTVNKSITIAVDTSAVTPTTSSPTTTGPPTITSFIATPSSIMLSENSTLSWSVSGARSVTITPGIGTVPSTGYMLVVPGDTTTYTLTAINSFGTASATTTVTATRSTEGDPPIIYAFRASPGTISAGQFSTLTWDIRGATVIVINPDIGIPASNFSQIVSPESTTTYTLTAINSRGSDNATVTVTVNP